MKTEEKQLIRSMVLQNMDLTDDIEDEKVNEVIDRCITDCENEGRMKVRDKLRIKRELFNSIRRLDILSELLDDDEITEIMINGAENIFIEKNGSLSRYNHSFESRHSPKKRQS